MIRQLVYKKIPMSPCQKWLKKKKSNFNRLYKRDFCTNRCRHAQEYIRIILIHYIWCANSLSSDSILVYCGTKSDIIILLSNALASHHIHTKCRSAIILEMSPIITAKCFSLPDNVLCFNDLAVVLFYEVHRLGSGYDRIDAVFDHYFDRGLKGANRISRGTRASFKIPEISKSKS